MKNQLAFASRTKAPPTKGKAAGGAKRGRGGGAKRGKKKAEEEESDGGDEAEAGAEAAVEGEGEAEPAAAEAGAEEEDEDFEAPKAKRGRKGASGACGMPAARGRSACCLGLRRHWLGLRGAARCCGQGAGLRRPPPNQLLCALTITPCPSTPCCPAGKN
jgi:hypothetical protein